MELTEITIPRINQHIDEEDQEITKYVLKGFDYTRLDPDSELWVRGVSTKNYSEFHTIKGCLTLCQTINLLEEVGCVIQGNGIHIVIDKKGVDFIKANTAHDYKTNLSALKRFVELNNVN